MKVARTLLEIQKEMVLLLPPELRPAAMAEGCVIHALIIAAAAQAHRLEEQVVEMFNSAAVDSKALATYHEQMGTILAKVVSVCDRKF
jgi:hypothetical protein